jgi:hypothetical protein
MYRDRNVRGAVHRMIAPLEKEGFDVFEARDHGQVAVSVNQEEAKFFEPTDAVDLLQNNESETIVEVVKPSLVRGYKWTVRDARGNFFVDVEDAAFLSQIEAGNVSFTKGDLLRIKLWIETSRDEVGGLHSRYSITKVVEHIHAAQQGNLKFSDD